LGPAPSLVKAARFLAIMSAPERGNAKDRNGHGHIQFSCRIAISRYQGSGVSSKNKVVERGYNLGTLRSLLDQGAIVTGIGWGPLSAHDLTVTRHLLRTSVHLRPGDTLLYDRGFLDGAEITFLKVERKVDVCTGLKSDMNLFKGAIVHAQACPGAWQAHPTRRRQRIQLVRDLSGLWPELGVPMNVCVVEDIDPKTGEIEYFCFVSTDLSLSAKQLTELYQTRPEIEESYRQLKGASWRIDLFHATRQVPILWHVILTLLAYNLFQVYANTAVDRTFTQKTKATHNINRMILRPQTRSKSRWSSCGNCCALP